MLPPVPQVLLQAHVPLDAYHLLRHEAKRKRPPTQIGDELKRVLFEALDELLPVPVILEPYRSLPVAVRVSLPFREALGRMGAPDQIAGLLVYAFYQAHGRRPIITPVEDYTGPDREAHRIISFPQSPILVERTLQPAQEQPPIADLLAQQDRRREKKGPRRYDTAWEAEEVEGVPIPTGEELAAMRQAIPHLTQKNLGDAIGLQRSVVAAHETGKRHNPKIMRYMLKRLIEMRDQQQQVPQEPKTHQIKHPHLSLVS